MECFICEKFCIKTQFHLQQVGNYMSKVTNVHTCTPVHVCTNLMKGNFFSSPNAYVFRSQNN